ncbi:hypothetical protein HER18_07565 [Chryseobacterium sp. NEB161]|nr:hypothetical protein HER18_07565 [Chryseobacterium sp. NEB161]
MKKFLKNIAFQIGVDILGFPQFHNHKLEGYYYISYSDSQYFKANSKK